MRVKNRAISVGGVSLLVILLLVGLTASGCIGIKTSPEGGSGGVVADGTLFLSPAIKQSSGFGCSAPATSGKLVALNTSDGSLLWEVPLESSSSGGGGFGCAPAVTPAVIYGNPAVAGDLVYVAGYNGKVYAANSTSGALRWVYPREGSLKPIVGGVVAAMDRVYFGGADGKVYALDAATGDLQPGFPFSTDGKIWATPAVSGEMLYIGSFDKKLYALSASDGSKQWEYLTEGAVVSTPLVYENTVYIGSFDRNFYALDAASGSLKWKYQADKWFWTRAVVSNGTIYAGCFDGKVYALGAESGEKIAEFDLGSPVYSWPVLVNGRVIFATEEGEIYAIDTAVNQERLLTSLEEAIYAPLCASDEVVYIYGAERNLYALNVESGARLWSLPIK